MYCCYCGAKNSDEMRFCSKCGKPRLDPEDAPEKDPGAEESNVFAEYAELSRRIKDGDEIAFAQMYERSSRFVYTTCYSMLGNEEDAKDAMQEVYITVYRSIGGLNDDMQFLGWLKKIAATRAFNVSRTRKRNISYDDAIEADSFVGDDDLEKLPDTYIMQETQRQALGKIMRDELSDVQYQTIVMHYYDGLSIEDIASIMGCPEGTVKTRLKAARVRIRAGVDKYEKDNKDSLNYAALPFLTRFFMAQEQTLNVPALNPVSLMIPLEVASTGNLPAPVAKGAKMAAKGAAKESAKKGGFFSRLGGRITATVLAVSAIGAATITTTKLMNKDKTDPGVGDTITLGSFYGQDIEWIILDENDNGETVIISKNVISERDYHDTVEDITWEDCTLRQWLNGEFYEESFSDSEKNVILTTHVVNDDNPVYGTPGGNDTEDKVFLLSLAEVEEYFESEPDRRCKVENGSYSPSGKPQDDYYQWYLRSPGVQSYCVAFVNRFGGIQPEGDILDSRENYGVRPVMTIDLNAYKSLSEERTIESETTETMISVDDTDVFIPSDAAVGDIITLGSYNGYDIDWLVLDKNDNGELFVISAKIVDSMYYTEATVSNLSWEICSLRYWLNHSFYNEAFTPAEQQQILLTAVKSDGNSFAGIDGGNDTEDYVYLLSYDEAREYFASDSDRACHYYLDSDYISDGIYWWLRSLSSNGQTGGSIRSDGSVLEGIMTGGQYPGGVRPVMWITPSTGDPSDHDTVSAAEETIAPSYTPTPEPTDTPTPTPEPTDTPTPTPEPVIRDVSEYVEEISVSYDRYYDDGQIWDTYEYHMPHLLISSDYCNEVNSIITSFLSDREAQIGSGEEPFYVSTRYTVFLTDEGVMSVVILYHGFTGNDNYIVYNIDVNTGEQVDNARIAEIAGIESIRQAAMDALQAYMNRSDLFFDVVDHHAVFPDDGNDYTTLDENVDLTFSEEKLNDDMRIGLTDDGEMFFISDVCYARGAAFYTSMYVASDNGLSADWVG